MPSIASNKRIMVLTFAGIYLPGYKGGGPIKTLKNLFDQSEDYVSFQLVTGDRDLGDKNPYSSVRFGEWSQMGSASVFYAKSGILGYKQIANILIKKTYDIVYINSFFSPKFSIYTLLLAKVLQRKIVIAPHGEFSKGALSMKPKKKISYIRAFKFLRFQEGLLFQASSKFEAADIRRVLGDKVDVHIAENIGSQDFASSFYRRQSGVLRAVFLSRISPMKNLLMALEVLRDIRIPLIYHIYGPIEDGLYWGLCQKIIETLPVHVKIEYRGSLNPLEVVRTISCYDVFFLPTMGENYGHAIAEAICAGLPVVISDRTPWRNLAEQGIGWDLPLSNSDGFRATLENLAVMPENEYMELRQRVLAWAKKKFFQRDAIEENISMFRRAFEKN